MSRFQTIVHQTIDDKDNAEEIENHGPFRVENISGSFLGKGYYFWDDHIELAHWWGQKHIKTDYVICEATLTVEKPVFLDLVGCRQDQIYIKDIISKIPKLQTMALGNVIEFLKEMSLNPNKRDVFPFKVIRAVNSSSTSYEENVIHFADGKRGKMTFTPQILICLIEKNKLHLQSYKIIYPNKYI